MSASPRRCSRPRSTRRDSHGGEGRIKAARFPARKTLEEFDFTFQRSVKKTVIEHLGQLDFLHGQRERRPARPARSWFTVHLSAQGVSSRSKVGAGTLMASPLRRPRVTWIACEFAALDLMQHGLAGAAERAGGVGEREIAVGDVGHEAGADRRR